EQRSGRGPERDRRNGSGGDEIARECKQRAGRQPAGGREAHRGSAKARLNSPKRHTFIKRKSQSDPHIVRVRFYLTGFTPKPRSSPSTSAVFGSAPDLPLRSRFFLRPQLGLAGFAFVSRSGSRGVAFY